jgi:regulator of replication initiation timing
LLFLQSRDCFSVHPVSIELADIKEQNNEEQEKNTKLRSNNASISYQIALQEQCHSRNLAVIAADEDRLEIVRSSINAAETEYAKYEDIITDKKNNLEWLSSKESELIEKTKVAESVYDLFKQGGTDDVRDKLIDVMYENHKLREENITLKELLEKVYEFMKQFAIDGVNLLERFLGNVGKIFTHINDQKR